MSNERYEYKGFQIEVHESSAGHSIEICDLGTLCVCHEDAGPFTAEGAREAAEEWVDDICVKVQSRIGAPTPEESDE